MQRGEAACCREARRLPRLKSSSPGREEQASPAGVSRPGRTSSGLDVAAEEAERLDCFRGEDRRLAGIGEAERTRRNRLLGALGGEDLDLDGDCVAVVDRTEHGDRAAVLAGVAYEQLSEPARRVRRGGAEHRALAHGREFAAAWATVVRSA